MPKAIDPNTLTARAKANGISRDKQKRIDAGGRSAEQYQAERRATANARLLAKMARVAELDGVSLNNAQTRARRSVGVDHVTSTVIRGAEELPGKKLDVTAVQRQFAALERKLEERVEARLEATFSERVRLAAVEMLDAEMLNELKERERKARRAKASWHGVFTQEQYSLLYKCLHPDRSGSEASVPAPERE